MNRQISITIVLGLFSAILVPSRSTFAAWSGQTADEVVSFDDDEDAYGVQVLFVDLEDQLVHLFWAEDAPSVREIHYGRSSDLGATWSSSTADRVISWPDGNAVFEEPAVTYGFSEELILVWSEDHLTTREVHYGISTDGGMTFNSETADLILSDVSTQADAGVPSVLFGPDGTIHVVGSQDVSGVAEVHYSRSTDGGTTWSGSSGDRIISFPDGNSAASPKLFLGDPERIFVAWRETGDLGRPVIQLGMSDDGGDTWSSETADREIAQPATLIADFGVVAPTLPRSSRRAIVYAASFDASSPFHYEVYATQTADNGVTWDGETSLVNVSFDEDHARSASNPEGYSSPCCDCLYAVWDEEDEHGGAQEQHVSRSLGGPWSGATGDSILSFPDGEDGYRPSITGTQFFITPPSSSGRRQEVWVAWTEFSGGANDNYEVHVSSNGDCAGTAVPEGGVRPALRLAPNPAWDHVRMFLPDALLSAIQILDAAGRVVYQATIRDADHFVWDLRSQDGQRVAAGVYMVRVRNAAGRTAAAPIVIQP